MAALTHLIRFTKFDHTGLPPSPHITLSISSKLIMAAFILNAGVAWDQTPEYIALTDHVIPPGGQTAYTRFHPTGPSPTDFTAFVYGQRDIHIGNWPEASLS